jgi:methylglutamate dehydrogenase subunit A
MRLNGIDAKFLSRDEIAAWIPELDTSPSARFPIVGGLLQPRGGTVRHDAVAWGYARAADARGVDIIQNCEVTGIRIENGAIAGVDTTRGSIATRKLGIAVAGNSSRLAAMAGIRLPIESHVLQAMVSEPIKPVLDTVVSSGAVHFYISQSDKGELVMGGDLDFYNSYAQRGNLPALEHVVAGCFRASGVCASCAAGAASWI